MFQRLLRKISRELKKTSLPYMVIVGKVKKIIQNAGPKILVKNERSSVEKTMVLPTLDEMSGIRVDFIFSFSPYEKQAIERGKDIKFGKTLIRFASLKDVVIHKVIAGRPGI